MYIIIYWVTHYGYVGIFALLVLGIVGIPIPDEILLMFSGYMIFAGNLHPAPVFFAASLGSACGISLSYALGRTFGTFLVARFGSRVHLTPERMHRVQAWFDRAGKWALTFGYFLPRGYAI